jgi:hypothetical protein
MNVSEHEGSLLHPRWDGSRITFEIMEAGEPVRCAISRAALQDLTGHRHFKSADLLRCFMEARERIEAIAAVKSRSRPQGATSIVSVWADDVDDVDEPPTTPAAARPMQQDSPNT